MNVDHDAVRKAYPNVVTISDDYYDADGVTVSVNQAQVDAARVTLDAEAAATLYQRQSTGEAGTTDTIYDTIGNQLDMLFHAIDADSDLKTKFATWHTHNAAVKAKYPKP